MRSPEKPEGARPTAGESTAELSPVGRQILAAARRIVAGEGLENLSLQAISTEAGVHKSAIGYHFGSKEGVILALIESLADNGFNEAIRSLVGIHDPSERFKAYLGVCREVITTTDHWNLVFGLWATPYYDVKMRVQMRTFMLETASLGLRGDAPASVLLMGVLRAALAGLAFQYKARREQMDIEACFEVLESAFAPQFLQAMEDPEAQ